MPISFLSYITSSYTVLLLPVEQFCIGLKMNICANLLLVKSVYVQNYFIYFQRLGEGEICHVKIQTSITCFV